MQAAIRASISVRSVAPVNPVASFLVIELPAANRAFDLERVAKLVKDFSSKDLAERSFHLPPLPPRLMKGYSDLLSRVYRQGGRIIDGGSRLKGR